jgi:Na+/H+ antiporter NhaD/arsenite permease-like protein
VNGFIPKAPGFVPFIALLLVIAAFPLIPAVQRFWEKNSNKLLVALALGAATLLYYVLAGQAAAVPHLLEHACLEEYVPFMVLLFALYTISGGIHLSGDIRATPAVNTAFLGFGAVLASLIGTTGASMLLIRPLLRTNSERKRKVHTVIFFTFIVSNIGGCLTPLGDPPLFLGYLLGVPFFWTFRLFPAWLFVNGTLLIIYCLWDRRAYAREQPLDIALDEARVLSLGIQGGANFLLLAAVVACVALVSPRFDIPGLNWRPFPYLREGLLLALVALSWVLSPGGREARRLNRFSFGAIIEVAFLFLGIFICMQPPLAYLEAKGADLGLATPAGFFWASGSLSSFLDNAPTYVVFFKAAQATTAAALGAPVDLPASDLLAAVSLGSVFMGANTYIGNGPNFMVKAIAEHAGVKMPSFLGYMAYSAAILIPLFLAVTFIFLRT